MQDFQRLNVWRKAHALSLDIYDLASSFPRAAGVTLSSQLRRAALSVPATIAEGAGKASDKDFDRFLDMAMGSAAEVRHHLLVARDLGYLESAAHAQLDFRAEELRKMLTGLRKRLRG